MTQLALVIDLNVCVGCHACVTSCKEWNTSGDAGALADLNPYGADPEEIPAGRARPAQRRGGVGGVERDEQPLPGADQRGEEDDGVGGSHSVTRRGRYWLAGFVPHSGMRA